MSRQIGETITLREFRYEDLPDMRAWVTDANVTRYLSGAYVKPQTWEQTEDMLRNLLQVGSGANFVIAENESLKYLGQCNLMMPDTLARKAELAIVLSPQNIGKGYGKEALSLLLAFGFNAMNLNRVFLKVHEDNLRAIRLYESAGFRMEGRLREDAYVDGHYIDTLEMGLLRAEWAQCNQRRHQSVQ